MSLNLTLLLLFFQSITTTDVPDSSEEQSDEKEFDQFVEEFDVAPKQPVEFIARFEVPDEIRDMSRSFPMPHLQYGAPLFNRRV